MQFLPHFDALWADFFESAVDAAECVSVVLVVAAEELSVEREEDGRLKTIFYFSKQNKKNDEIFNTLINMCNF